MIDDVPSLGEERRVESPAVAPHPLRPAFLFRHEFLDGGENHAATRDVEQPPQMLDRIRPIFRGVVEIA